MMSDFVNKAFLLAPLKSIINSVNSFFIIININEESRYNKQWKNEDINPDRPDWITSSPSQSCSSQRNIKTLLNDD